MRRGLPLILALALSLLGLFRWYNAGLDEELSQFAGLVHCKDR